MSCLFNSLSNYLELSPVDIRNAVCTYLEKGGPLLDGLLTPDVLKLEDVNYVKTMQKCTTWGGAIEIQAACNIWKMRVLVRNARDSIGSDIEFLPVSADYDRTIHLRWNGGHYEAITTLPAG